jgi:hypothetical protein
MISFILGFIAGVIATAVSQRLYKWATKQVDDAKTHIPGA